MKTPKTAYFLLPLLIGVFGSRAFAQTPSSESEALRELGQMTQAECRGAFLINAHFYEATKSMSDVQRRALFASIVNEFVQRGFRPPRPPPPPDSPWL